MNLSFPSVNIPKTGLVAVIGLAMLLLGAVFQTIGNSGVAGFLGLYGIAILIFAVLGTVSLTVLKSLSTLILN